MIGEIWCAVSCNALADFDTEAEALTCVRGLISVGWKAEEIGIIFEDPALADDELPPGILADEFIRRIEAGESSYAPKPGTP